MDRIDSALIDLVDIRTLKDHIGVIDDRIPDEWVRLAVATYLLERIGPYFGIEVSNCDRRLDS